MNPEIQQGTKIIKEVTIEVVHDTSDSKGTYRIILMKNGLCRGMFQKNGYAVRALERYCYPSEQAFEELGKRMAGFGWPPAPKKEVPI